MCSRTQVSNGKCNCIGPVNGLVDSSRSKPIQIPMTYEVDPEMRKLVAKFHPPYQSNESLLSDLVTEYDKIIGQYERPLVELQEKFKIDVNKQVVEVGKIIIEESLIPESKRQFYHEELANILNATLKQDVEWSSLRLESNQLVSTHAYDPLTG